MMLDNLHSISGRTPGPNKRFKRTNPLRGFGA
jgi:hypothetical protein